MVGARGFIRRTVDRLTRSSDAKRRVEKYNREAREVYRALGPDGAVSAAVVKQCLDYAGSVLGDPVHAPWLQVYSALAGEFREGWIPSSYFATVVLPRVNAPYGKVDQMRPLSRLVLRTDSLPDVAHKANGRWWSLDQEPLHAEALVDQVAAGERQVVFKADDSARGRGIRVFDPGSLDPDVLERLGNGVLQYMVQPHATYRELSPGGAATLRVTTTIGPGSKPRASAAFLRLGRTGHSHVSASDSMRVPVDVATGALDPVGYTSSWQRAASHPDTGLTFSGITLPEYSACVSLAEDLHAGLPYPAVVGWDLCVDSGDSVKLFEWNAQHPDIKFSEATTGPCFTDMGWEDLWKQA